jgi:hypothetical protein
MRRRLKQAADGQCHEQHPPRSRHLGDHRLGEGALHNRRQQGDPTLVEEDDDNREQDANAKR